MGLPWRVRAQPPAAPPAIDRTGEDPALWVLGGLAALYAVLAVGQLVRHPGTARPIMALAATISCLLLAAGAAWVLRRTRRGAPLPAGLEAYTLIPVANGLLRLALTRDLHHTSTLMLVVVAAGAVVRTTRIAALVAGVAVAGWVGVVVATPLHRAPELRYAATQLAVAVVIAGLLHLAVRRREGNLRRARDELATVADQFRRIFDDSPVGIGVADAEGRLLAANPAFCRLVDRPAADLLGASDLAYTHPDDRPGHAATGSLIEHAGEGGVADVEKRYVRPDGSLRWAWLSLTHVRPTADAPGPWTLAHVQDVTTRREAVEALRDSERNLAAVTSVARRIRQGEDARMSIVDALHTVAGADTALLVEAGRDGDGALAVTAARGSDLVGTRIPAGAASVPVEVFRRGEPLFLTDPAAEALPAPAEARSVLCQPVVTRGRTTAVLYVSWNEAVEAGDRQARAVALLADETALALDHERLLAELELVARTDQLTGLANRRDWDLRLPEFLANARRHGRPLAVAIADLDHFKTYNDLHGHLAGDEMLRQTAASFAAALRAGDLLCRWGGEEFALALPDCSAGDAGAVLDRVRGSVSGGRTCSIGFAVWDGGETADDLVARADAALYQAKRSGRDRVVEAPGVLAPLT